MEKESIRIKQLEEEISILQEENVCLKVLLDKAGIDYSVVERNHYKEEMYDSNQGTRIISAEITHNHARRFFSYFWGRMDVYASDSKIGQQVKSGISRSVIISGNAVYVQKLLAKK